VIGEFHGGQPFPTGTTHATLHLCYGAGH
jgi:hypothetical protein